MIRENHFQRSARKSKFNHRLKSLKITAMCFVTRANDCTQNRVLRQVSAITWVHRLRPAPPPPRRRQLTRHLSMTLKLFIVLTAPMQSLRRKQWKVEAMNSSIIIITIIPIKRSRTSIIFQVRQLRQLLQLLQSPSIPPHQLTPHGWRRNQSSKVSKRRRSHQLNMIFRPPQPIPISSNLSSLDPANMQLLSTFTLRLICPRPPLSLSAALSHHTKASSQQRKLKTIFTFHRAHFHQHRLPSLRQKDQEKIHHPL